MKKTVALLTVIIFVFIIVSSVPTFAAEEKDEELSEGTKALYAIALVVLVVGIFAMAKSDNKLLPDQEYLSFFDGSNQSAKYKFDVQVGSINHEVKPGLEKPSGALLFNMKF